MILFSCKGQDPLTSAKVDGALGPKFPELVLNSLSPTDGQTHISLKPNIVLNFSSSVVPLSVTVNLNSSFCIGSVQLSKDNFVTCEQLVPPISNNADTSFTISPIYDLSELTYYKIKVTNKIVDTVGYFLSNPYISNLGFKTLDSNPPFISATFPAEEAVEVNQDTNITLIFNEKMDASSITTNFSGTDCSGTFQLSKDSFFTCVPMFPPYTLDGKSFTSDPIDPLESLETYQVRALTQIKDFEGNHLTNEYIGKGFKVKDWTPPVVISTIPVQGASEVSFQTFISSTFSKKMDINTIKGIDTGNLCGGSFQVSADNFATCIPVFQPIISVDQKSFSFKPQAVLNPGTLYKFKFTTAVKDMSGLSLATPYIGSFTSAYLPFVNSTNPLAGAVQVAATSTLSVTFNEVMDESSIYSNPNSSNCDIGTFHFAKSSTPNICIPLGPVTSSNNSKTFTATPIQKLENQETYIIKVSKLVRSNAGYEMASSFEQSPGFRIYDTTPPDVEAGTSTPSNNSSDFVVSDPITIKFDESMNPASMGGLYTGSSRTSCIGTIQLSKDNFLNCIAFTSSNPTPSNNEQNFTVVPKVKLDLSTEYKIKVTTAAQDKYGNYLSSPMYINFKTIDPVQVQSTNPPNALSPLVAKNTNIQITFNRAVLNSTISFITSGATCSGSIQLSKDNFSNCVSFLSQTLPGIQNQVIAVTPTTALANFSNYKIKVLNTVKDKNNISMASTYTQSIGFKTEDTIPPYVVSTTPYNNATLVARNTSLIVNFDEAMVPLTISTNSTSTVCSGSLQMSKDNFATCVQMDGQPIQDPQGMVWTMQPVSILDNFTYYKFKVLAGVKDTQGNALATAYNPEPGFQTIDDVPPTLISSSPASGTLGVPSDSNIVLTFSEAMNPSTITTSSSSICGSSSVQLQIGPTFSSCMQISSTTSSLGNTVFTFDPTNSLGNSGTSYNLRVYTIVKDVNGNPLSSVLNIPFRATDIVAPTVASYLPLDGSKVSIGSDLRVTFSEEIQPNSLITNQGVDANCSGKTWYAQVGGVCQLMNPFTASSNNTSFLMEPQEFFPRDATVTVTIRDVLDFQGNALASPTSYSFTTDNPAQASLVSSATEVLLNSSIQVGFDVAMESNTLTLNNSNNSCSSGNIQVSSNNFVTCIQFTSNLASETSLGSKIYQLTPSTELNTNTTYKLRVKTGAKTTNGDSWPVDQDFSFITVIPPVITAVLPANSTFNAPRNSSITFTFSKPMEITSLTTNTTDNNCSGSVQASTDTNFFSCLQMNGAPLNVSGNIFRVTPASPLPNDSLIYFKVTTDVLDTVGQNMLVNFDSSFKTADEIKPTVLLTVPASNATNVINNATMSVSFSEPIKTSTITVGPYNGPCTGSIQITSDNFVSCLGLTSLGFSATNTVFTFVPVSNLPDASTITARVLNTVTDIAGNSLAATYTWSFTSNTVPTVLSITPASSLTYQDLNSDIVVVFNKSMNDLTFTPNIAPDCSNGNILFSTDPSFLNCNPILTKTFSATDTTVTFTVDLPLNELTTYYFKIKNSVSDLDGMKPVSDFTSSFTTGDAVPPIVISTIPVAGAVNTNENLISITFSEAMATSTITSGSANCATGNILVSSDSFLTCAPLNSSPTLDNITFNFVPSPSLAPFTTYQIKVSTAVMDLSGNMMTLPYESTFTVKDYIQPTIISAAPTATTTNVPADASITVTFSESMNTNTLTANLTNNCDSNSGFLFSQDNFTTCLPVLNPITTDQTTFNFVPLNGLYNGNYQYKLNTSVEDTSGNNIIAAYTNSFTVNDSNANTVTMSSPTNGSFGVPFGAEGQPFSILFSAAVSSPTVTTNTVSTTCSGNVQLSADNFVTCVRWSSVPATTDNLNFNLGVVPNNLLSNTTYLLKVSKNIATTAVGKSLKNDYIFNFVTDISPTVISLTPPEGTTTVATWGPNTIKVTFDTDMNPSTIVGTTDGSCGKTGVDLSINNFINCLPLSPSTTDNKTYYLTPMAALQNYTKYYLRITPKAKSSTGNPIIGYYPNELVGRTFTTTLFPTIVSTFPTNGATGISTNQNLQIYFSEPMINVNTNGNTSNCTGTVQLSSDDFLTCVGLFSPSNSEDIDWFISPRNALSVSTTYKLKILGNVNSTETVKAIRGGYTLGTDYIATFSTSATSLVALTISNENLNCLEESYPKIQGIAPTKITWEKSKETLVNSDGGGYQIFYQKDDTNLYCKKIPYVDGEWTLSETTLNLTKGLWKVRLKSYSRLNPEGSIPSEIKKIVVP